MKPATSKTICVVLEHYAAWLQQVPAHVRSDVAAAINKHLDEMRNDDAFGTDGRQDPRGA